MNHSTIVSRNLKHFTDMHSLISSSFIFLRHAARRILLNCKIIYKISLLVMLVYPMLAMIEFKYTHKVCTIIKLLRLLANKLRRA